jgi:fibronectin-binding autotransporter adhesin
MSFRYLIPTAICLIAGVATAAPGDPLYFDADPSTSPIDGGAVAWNDANWKAGPAGTGGVAWSNGDSPRFEPITGNPGSTTITISGTVTTGFGAVRFNGPGYTITGGTLDTDGTWFYMNAPATVNSQLKTLMVYYDSELTIGGGGTLNNRAVIGGSNVNSVVRQTGGDLAVVGNYMMIGGNNKHFGNARGHYIIDGGTLTVDNGIYFGWNAATDYGTLTQNGGTVTVNGQGLQLGIAGGHGTYHLNGGTVNAHIRTTNNPASQTFNFGGGTFVHNATGATSTSANMVTTIADGATAYIDAGSHNLTWAGTISGNAANGLTHQGGTLIFTAENTYAGTTTVEAGTLWLGNGTAQGSVAGDIVVEAGATVRDHRNGNRTWSNNISGSGGVAAGARRETLTLSGDNSYSGGTRIYHQLILKVGSPTALGTGPVTCDFHVAHVGAGALDLNGYTIDNDVVLEEGAFYKPATEPGTGVLRNSNTAAAGAIDGHVTLGGHNYIGGGAGDFAINGVISGGTDDGTYALLKAGSGTVTLANEANTYDGFTYVAEGVLEVTKLANQGQSSSLGQASTTARNVVNFSFRDGGTLRFIGSTASTSDRTFVLGGGGNENIIEASGTAPAATLTLTGDTSGAGVFTLGGTNQGANTFAGTIGSTSSLVKDGPGTWVLSGENTYSGDTQVNGGTLLVSNTAGSGTGSGAVAVAAGAALGGTGSIDGGVDLAGIVSPGASVGALATGSQTWNQGAGFLLEMADAAGSAGSGWDLLEIDGALDLSGLSTGGFTLTLGSLGSPIANFDPVGRYAWEFARTTGGIDGFEADDFAVDATAFAGEFGAGSILGVEAEGGSLYLTYSVPEPSSALLLLCGTIGLAVLRRPRRK